METEAESGLIERLAGRLRPSGALASLEEPRTIVWIAIIWTWGSAFNTFLIASIFFAYDEQVSSWIAVALALTYIVCWFVFVTTGSALATFAVAVGASMLAVPAFHLTLGGYAFSGAQPVWAIGVTVVAALLFSGRAAVGVGVYWIIGAVVFGFLEESLQASRPPPDPGLPAVFFPYNIVAHLILLVPVIFYLLSRLAAERARSESLLLNILPESIAARLKASRDLIADEFPNCSVLFADISGFTAHTRRVPLQQLVEELNTIFSGFDHLAQRHGVQKIKTTGDGYMAVAGVPEPHPNHLGAVCELALEMQREVPRLAGELADGVEVRIGLHTGTAVAGIIGTSRFSYDVWGETVNLASRLEENGEPGRIQVSEAVVRGAGGDYEFEPAGTIELKGIGQVETFWLVGRSA